MNREEPPYQALTPREIDILAGMVEGSSNREMAEELVLSVGTVRWYTKQIYSKLGVHSRKDAVRMAERYGLLSGGVEPLLVKHNLPAQTTPFIGRERELEELTALIADPQTRLVTVLAAGGMGKTRLALEAAERTGWR